MRSEGLMPGFPQDSGAPETRPCTAAAPATTWPVPEAPGSHAVNQWSIRRRVAEREWKALMQALPGRVGARARQGGNARHFIEAVLWVAQTGACWSCLPGEFGSWRSIYVRFLRWSQDGNWTEVLACFEARDQRAQDLRALVQRYLLRNSTKHMSKAMRTSCAVNR